MALAVLAMIYVTLARGQLLGSSVLIHKAHFPEIFEVVERCSALIGIPVPLVFVRDDIMVPVVTLGFGEPYSLVLSSHWLKHFEADELTFVIGRELGNIAAGHTRITSLLSVNGRENALIAIIFGAWLRRTEYTADRFGLLCCGSLDAADRAITMAQFHHFGREVDVAAFAAQREAFGGDSVLNMGEWLSAQPYATNRMARLKEFRASALYGYWEDLLIKNPVHLQAYSPVPREGTVTRVDCAGFGRRIGVFLIDCFVVASIFALTPAALERPTSNTAHRNTVQLDDAAVNKVLDDASNGKKVTAADLKNTIKTTAGEVPTTWSDVLVRFFGGTITKNGADTSYNIKPAGGFPQEFMIYTFILIALGGQTLGMMILAVKVTNTKFHRPPVWQVVWRTIVSPLGAITFLLGPFVKVELHDRLSGTRVVKLERTFERTPAPQ